MRAKAIHVYAPIVSPHLVCGYDAVLADFSSIVAKERPALSKSPSEVYVGGVKFITPEAPDYAAAWEVYNAGILTQPKIIACSRRRLAFNTLSNEQRQRIGRSL